MYTQYFLKFESQEECYDVLRELGWYGQQGEFEGFILDGHSGAIDEVGLIVDEPATYEEVLLEEPIITENGEEITTEYVELTPTTYVDGWHVNIVIKETLPEVLEPFIVTPTTPSRIFAGFEV